MTQPVQPKVKWPLWILGATLLTLLSLALAYLIDPKILGF